MERFGAVSDLVLRIHRAANEEAPDRFQDAVLAELGAILPFDSCTWGVGTMKTDGLRVRAALLFREVPGRYITYDEIRSEDDIAFQTCSKPGSTLNFHLPTLFAGQRKAAIREYVRRVRHANELVTTEVDRDRQCVRWVALFRADAHDQFSERQRALCEMVFPHLMEALRTNRALALARGAVPGDPIAAAIVDHSGNVLCRQGAFGELMRREWEGSNENTIADELRQALIAGCAIYRGHRVVVSITRSTHTAILRVRPRCPADNLSPRELDVARLIAAGRTHKDIARVLGLSPATVRNHTQNIHDRLEVRTNAGVAAELLAAGLLDRS